MRIAMIGLRGIPATYGGVERAVEELSAQLDGLQLFDGDYTTYNIDRAYSLTP